MSRKMKLIWLAAVGLAGILVAWAPLAIETGCTPAESAVYTKVEDTVLALLNKGAALPDIEAAVSALLPGASGEVVDLVITAAVDVLHATGVLSPTVLPGAIAVQGQIAVKQGKPGCIVIPTQLVPMPGGIQGTTPTH